MDWLTFVAELVKATAWPAFLFAFLLVLRKPIAELVPLLRKLKYREFEAEFGARLEEVENLKEEIAPPAIPQQQQPPPPEPQALYSKPARPADAEPLSFRRIEANPRSAIIEAWMRVEAAARTAVRRLDVVAIVPRSPLQLIRILDKAEALDPAQVAMFHELRSLRNEAAHSPEMALSPELALKYVDLAFSLQRALDATGKEKEG
jgi:hypothetical protein